MVGASACRTPPVQITHHPPGKVEFPFSKRLWVMSQSCVMSLGREGCLGPQSCTKSSSLISGAAWGPASRCRLGGSLTGSLPRAPSCCLDPEVPPVPPVWLPCASLPALGPVFPLLALPVPHPQASSRERVSPFNLCGTVHQGPSKGPPAGGSGPGERWGEHSSWV